MKNLLRFIVGSFIVLFSSCLKDDSQILKPGDNTSVVEFGNSGNIESNINTPVRLYIQSFNIVPLDTVIVPINYAGAKNASKDIIVKIAVANNLIDSLNAWEEYEFEPLNPSLYELPQSVTISAGSQTAYLKIPVKINQIDFNSEYALALKITDASGETISGNFSSIVINVGPKNVYDGIYNYRTSATTSLVPNANKTVELHTAGPNRLRLIPGLLGTYSNEVYYNINPSTYQITVECPSLGVQSPQDVRSKYDPATKVLKVYWKQGNGGRTFEETFTYISPR